MIAESLKALLPKSLRPTGYFLRLVKAMTDNCVRSGPFRGMRYVDQSFSSAYVPKLLGIYEKELHPLVESSCNLPWSLILDIGAAEGYYAVGLARRNPRSRVLAYETEAKGRAAIREMALLNGVHDRVIVHGKCELKDLSEALATAPEALIVCDIEGAEMTLLNPSELPALNDSTILVEVHDHILPGSGEELRSRFVATHRITHIWQVDRERTDFPFSTWYTRCLPWSRLESAAVSEWRPGRMSWFWMEPIGRNRGDDRRRA